MVSEAEEVMIANLLRKIITELFIKQKIKNMFNSQTQNLWLSFNVIWVNLEKLLNTQTCY